MPPGITPILSGSRQSLLLDLRWVENGQDNSIGTATGFVVEAGGHEFLMTNRHVMTGIHQDTGKFLSTHGVGPTHVDIRHLGHPTRNGFVTRREALYFENGTPRWVQNPNWGDRADVVALPLTELVETFRFPYSVDPVPDHESAMLLPTVDVSIVGYPFGLTGSGDLAIWTRGVIASEPAMPYLNMPVFLVDSRTREGQSGSPVIVQRVSGMVAMKSGRTVANSNHTELVGIYSGRINDESDIGMVWTLDAIREVLAAATTAS